MSTLAATPGASRPAAALLVLLLHVLGVAALWTLAHPGTSQTAQAPIGVRLLATPLHPTPPPALALEPPVRVDRPRASPASLASPALLQTTVGELTPTVSSASPVGAGEAVAAPAVQLPAQAPAAMVALAEAPAAPARVLPARRGECPAAPHPPLLRERGIEGVVRLRVWVDEAGRAARIELAQSSGFRLFDEAASRQAQACPYEAARRDGSAVGSWVEFAVRFELRGITRG